MLLDYKSLHDGLNKAEINALYSILRKETIFTETLFMGTTGKYGVYNIVDTGIQVVNAVPTGQYTFNFSDGTVGVGVANDEGIVDVDVSFDRSSVCDVVITFPPYITSVDYNLSLTGDKSIIQKNESVVVTALLTMDGSLVSGESLDYVVKHGNRVLDSGTITTGNDGTASISYTGNSVGIVTFEVNYHTLQETYEVYDCIYIDYAVSGNKNTKWVNQQSGGSPCYTVTVDSTGTSLVKNANGNYTPSTVADSTSWNDRLLINEPYTVEFDLVEVNANGGAFRMYYNNSFQQQSDITVTGTGHYKFVMEQDKVYYIKDDGNPITLADNLNITIFENPTFVNCANIKFKNFIVYKNIIGYNLTLSSDKDILSAHDGESATITALLTEDNVPIEDIELEYSIKHDNTVIDSGTITTNSDGEANIVYTATGVGDVDVIVSYGTLLQETYELEDCQFYDSLTSNSGHWSIPADVTFGYNEYSSDGWKLGNASSFVMLDPNVSLTLPCKVSFKLMDRYSYTPQLDVGNDYVEFNDTHLNINETNLYATISNNKEYSFIIRSDSIEAYQDDTYLGKVNISISQTNLRLSVGNNRYFKIKDFKVKAL